MKAIFVLVFSGIRRKKVQMGVFAAGCFLCSFFLLGMFVLNFTLDLSFDTAYGKLGAPNMNAGIQETKVSEDSLEGFLGGLAYLQSYRISKCYLVNNVSLPGRNMDFAFMATSAGLEPEEGGVIVNNAVYGVNPGDEIEVFINGRSISLRVDFVVEDAVNSAPESMIPYFWIGRSELEALTEGYGKGSYLIEMQADNAEKGAEWFLTDYEKYYGQPFDGDFKSYRDIKRSYLFG